MSIEDGQKKFAAKRKQRRCHDSCPIVLLRIVYYLLQLVCFVVGIGLIISVFVAYNKLQHIAVSEDDGDTILTQLRPILQLCGGIGLIMSLLSLLGMLSVGRQSKFLVLLYVICLIGIAAMAFVSLKKMATWTTLLTERLQTVWMNLSDARKSAIQQLFHCCGLKNRQDMPGGECPPDASLGCIEVWLTKVNRLQTCAIGIFMAVSGLETLFAVTSLLMVFLC
jgi:hypothetical protein